MKTDVEKIFQKYGRIAGISMHKVIMIQHDVTLAQGDLFMIRHDMAWYFMIWLDMAGLPGFPFIRQFRKSAWHNC